ncbi:MAG: TRAP transporter substrate-binding protein DctP [Solibacillus sp.]
MNKLKETSLLTVLLLLVMLLVACSEKEVETEASVEANTDQNLGAGEIQEVKIKLAHIYSPDIFTYEGYEKFANLVSEKSNGKVKVTIYPAGQLYNDSAIPNAIASGQLEMGVTTFETWASNIPATEFNTLPIFDDQEHFRNALKSGVKDIIIGELGGLGVKPLIWTEFGFSYFASNDSALTTPESFVGKNIRTISPLMSKFVELAGGTPVAIPAVEVPQALQRGTVDAAVSGVTAFVSWKYYDYTNYYSGPFNPGLVLLSANGKWWDTLNEATQNVILEAAKEAEDFLTERHDVVNDEAKATLAEKEMQYEQVNLSDFESAITPLKEEFLSRSGDVGEEILKIVEESR